MKIIFPNFVARDVDDLALEGEALYELVYMRWSICAGYTILMAGRMRGVEEGENTKHMTQTILFLHV